VTLDGRDLRELDPDALRGATVGIVSAGADAVRDVDRRQHPLRAAGGDG
jgi:hypothetical protein